MYKIINVSYHVENVNWTASKALSSDHLNIITLNMMEDLKKRVGWIRNAKGQDFGTRKIDKFESIEKNMLSLGKIK